MLTLLTCFFFRSCDPFSPYLKSFEKEINRRVSVTIKFGELKGELNAACFHDQNEVVVNSKRWGLFNEVEREEIIFHELGHCFLGREHTETGIMRERPLEASFYLKNRSALIAELVGS